MSYLDLMGDFLDYDLYSRLLLAESILNEMFIVGNTR